MEKLTKLQLLENLFNECFSEITPADEHRLSIPQYNVYVFLKNQIEEIKNKESQK